MTRVMTILVLAVVMTLVVTAPGWAETIIGCEYETEHQLWAWDLGFEYPLMEWLDFGATLKCYLDPKTPYGYKANLIPAGVPYLQGYEIWARFKWRDFSFMISDWCNHYLAQSGVSAYFDTWGLTLRAELRI